MKYISLLIKPAGATCNMACHYCFYRDVAGYQAVPKTKMDKDVMEKVIERAFAAVDADGSIQFAFQGGEPTLAGLTFFEAFVAKVNTHRSKQNIRYSIQTNGLLLDAAWIAFFKRHDFLVGISIDGYAKLHDEMRVDRQGKGTYWQVISAYEQLRKQGVRVNVLCVLHAHSVAHIQAIFRFFAEHHVEYLQFIPCLEELEDGKQYISPQQLASGYCTLFALWWKHYQEKEIMHIGLFDDLLLMCMDRLPLTCGRLGICAFQNVIEADGTIYPCDFYAYDAYACGNVVTHSLQTAKASEAAQRCLKKELPTFCKTCSYVRFCRGGCKRKRTVFLDEAKEYCGYRVFLEYSLPYLMEYAKVLKQM